MDSRPARGIRRSHAGITHGVAGTRNVPHKRKRQRPRSLALPYGELAGYLNHHLPVQPEDESAGFPNIPHLQAVPAMEFRVSSNLASFSGTADEVSGCPAPSLPRIVCRCRLRVSPHPASSGCAKGEIPGCPEPSLPQRRHPMGYRVSPNPGTFRRLPHLRLRASPNPASTAGSMMTPPLHSNFASSGLRGPRMNLRVQSGLAHSRLTLDAISVSSLPYCAGYAGSVKHGFHPIPHRPARLELRFQFPTGPSLGKECGPVRSVEASAKLALICGYHQSWCINRSKLICGRGAGGGSRCS